MQFQSSNFQKLILIFLFICVQGLASTGGVLYFAGVADSPPASGTPPVTDYVAWYDAADTSTITTDGSGNVQTWADKSGNGYDAQKNGTAPTSGDTTLNNKNVVVFHNDWLDMPLGVIPSSNVYTVCAVWRVHYRRRTLVALGNEPAQYPEDANQVLWIHDENADYLQHRWFGDDLNSSSGSISDSTPFYSVCSYDGTNRYSYLNDASWNDAPSNTLALGSNIARMGGTDSSNGAYNMDGDYIAELIIYHRALTSSEINDTITYLKDKWGL